MGSGSCSLTIPTLDVDGEAVQRALQAARVPAAVAAAVRPDVRAVLLATRAACKELGAAPRPELLRPACLVRFAASAWPAREFHRCVLTCLAAHWLGAGVPYGWVERGPGVFRVIEAIDGGVAEAAPEQGLRTCDAALRPAFRPEVVSWTCCAHRARPMVGVVDVGSLFTGLPDGLREVALQERFCHAAAGPGGITVGMPCALFWNGPGGVMGAVDLGGTRPARPGDVAALQVLRELETRARQGAAWLQLQAGEVLLLDNRRALHAVHCSAGGCHMLFGQWRGSLLALGNFAGTGVPGMFSAARARCLPAQR